MPKASKNAQLTNLFGALPRLLGHLGEVPLAENLPDLPAVLIDAVHVPLLQAPAAAPLALP